MNSCEKVRMHLALLLYGELSFDQEEAVDGHLEGCAECRAALERERKLHAALDQVEVEPPASILWDARRNLQERIAHHEVNRVPGGHVRWLKMTGADAAHGHRPVDFVFVDGDHSEAGLLSDWNAWSGLVEPAGIVALHDSRSTPERPIDDAGSVKVTKRVILQDSRFQQIDAVDSLTVLRKR
jgi:predicted O-methyltransferase YrrM